MKITAEEVAVLIKSSNYSSFVLTYKELRDRHQPFSYAMIAQRAGFASRSFPRAVAIGAKRLTPSSLMPMIKGLGLTGEVAELFKTLVYLEHPEMLFPAKPVADLNRKLEHLKLRLLKKKKLVSAEYDPYSVAYFPLIYAACGDQHMGVTLKDIIRKTKLTDEQVESSARELLVMKLLTEKKGRYCPTDSHIFMEGLGQSQAFRKFFLYLLSAASEASRKNFKSEENLFFTTCFSVHSNQMSQLKSDLREVLLRYAESSESPDGDRIASVVCALI